MFTSLEKLKKNFDVVRKNALANSKTYYMGKYMQKDKKDAYIEYLEDLLYIAIRESNK